MIEKRGLSGIYFRIQKEDGKFDSVAFEDISVIEQKKILQGRSEEWLKDLALKLADSLRSIGDQFDIVAVHEENAEEIKESKELQAIRAMMNLKFDSHDWACLHDCVYNATYDEKTEDGKSFTQSELEVLFLEMPENMKMDAFKWGMSDTPWRDEVYAWYQKNKM